MWFNSTQREEPYQGLTWNRRGGRPPFAARHGSHRCCMAVVSSCREVLGLVPQRAQPPPLVAFGLSRGTAADNAEEGGDDVKSSWPLRPGLHTCYNGRHNGQRRGDPEPIPKAGLSSDWSLQLDSMKLESLVIADQNAAVNTFPGLVHTARQAMEGKSARSRQANRKGASV